MSCFLLLMLQCVIFKEKIVLFSNIFDFNRKILPGLTRKISEFVKTCHEHVKDDGLVLRLR